MSNLKFYTAKERKNDFVVTVNYLQRGSFTHSIRKTVLKGKRVLGMETFEVKNENFKTEEQYNKCICKCSSDRFEIITESKFVYED